MLRTSSRAAFVIGARSRGRARAPARRARGARRPRRRRSRASRTRSEGSYRKLEMPAADRLGRRAAHEDHRPAKQHASRQALSTPLRRRDRRAPRGRQPGAAVSEPARLRARAVLPAVQGRAAVRALRRSSHGARARGRVALSSLRRASTSSNGSARRAAGERDRRRRGHAARRRRARGAVSAARGSAGSTATSRTARARSPRCSMSVASGTHRHLDRHADAHEGPRLPARDARRRAERGSGTVRHGPSQPRAARADDSCRCPAARGAPTGRERS